MNIYFEIIKQIISSSSDEREFKKINFDEEKIKNMNHNFKDVIVQKPWGYEYLFFSSKKVSIWILKILKNHKTSMHCHTNKKTSLILLDGEANFYTLDNKINLKCGNAVTIEKKVFHRTSSECGKDTLVMEIETPTNKNDIVRYQDDYKRSNSGYESNESFKQIKEMDNFLNYNYIKNRAGILGQCELKIVNSNSKEMKKLKKNNLICPIKANNDESENQSIIGELYDIEKNNWSKDILEFLVIQGKENNLK